MRTTCQAFLKDCVNKFPSTKKQICAKKIEVSAGIITKNKRVYIQQRAKNGLMGGLWEFPGGKREIGESLEECLKREIKEELRANIDVSERVMTIKHTYTNFRVILHVFSCKLQDKRIRPKGCEQWKWVSLSNLKKYPFPAANVKIVKYLTEK